MLLAVLALEHSIMAISKDDKMQVVYFRLSDARNDRQPGTVMTASLFARFNDFVDDFNMRSEEQSGRAVLVAENVAQFEFPERLREPMGVYIDDARRRLELTLADANWPPRAE